MALRLRGEDRQQTAEELRQRFDVEQAYVWKYEELLCGIYI